VKEKKEEYSLTPNPHAHVPAIPLSHHLLQIILDSSFFVPLGGLLLLVFSVRYPGMVIPQLLVYRSYSA